MSAILPHLDEHLQLKVVEMTSEAIDRILALSRRHLTSPESRLSDRDLDACHDQLLDRLDADWLSDVMDDTVSDEQLGANVRKAWREVVINRLSR